MWAEHPTAAEAGTEAVRSGSGWQLGLECGGRSRWQNKYQCPATNRLLIQITTEGIMWRGFLFLLFISNVLGMKVYPATF